MFNLSKEQLVQAVEQSGILIVREVHGLFATNQDSVFPHIMFLQLV